MKNLSGKWYYIKDDSSVFSIEQIKEEIKKNNYSGKIDVPSNWNAEELDNFYGTLWYVKKIKIPKTNQHIKLLFEGVDYFTDVWLNWNYIGSHEGYFQAFGFTLDNSVIKTNENILVVKVTSPIEIPGKVWPDKKQLIKGIFNHHDCRPGGWSKKYGQDRNTGGIWNDVKLICEKDIAIENVKVFPKIKNNFAEIKITFNYKSHLISKTTALTKYSIKSGNNKTETTKFEISYTPQYGEVTVVIKIENPELWYPWEMGEPILTKLKISSSLFNDVNIRFGIREVRLNEKQEFFINGKRLFLRGTNIIPEQFLSNLTSAGIRKLITALKEANINIVRVHAHVNRRELYEALDKAGILVWQDFALQWTYDESELFTVNAVSQIKDMVKQFYNHPSIVFWCCHNEPGEQIESLDWHLYEAVKGEDQSRIIRRASNYDEHPYDGWYWGKAEHFIATPMGPLVTEFGAQAIPEYDSLKKIISDNKDIKEFNWDKWEYHNFQYEQTFNVAGTEIGSNIKEFIEASQKYQAELIETAVDYYRRKKWNGITGIFQFMFVDGWESISWSLVDYFGKKKKGYFALQKAFAPLYLSIDLKKYHYQNGAELFMELRIINDLFVELEEVNVEVYLNKKRIILVSKINVESNSVKHLGASYFQKKLYTKIEKSEIKILLTKGGKNIIACNKKMINIYNNKRRLNNENINC